MNTQVYFHRIRRIYDKYLTEFMASWGKEHYKTTKSILEYDDMDLLVEMKTESMKEGPRSKVARRIIERDHHKQVYETGDSANYLAMRKAKVAFQNLKAEFRDVDFIIDDGAASIHKQIVPSDNEEESAWDPIYVARKHAPPKPIGEESKILSVIPKRFRNVRVFASSPTNNLPEIAAAMNRQMAG